MQQIKLGKRVRVSDPCYGTSVWCSGIVDNVKEGTYNVEVEISDEGMWGKRVQSLTVIHTDYKGPRNYEQTDFVVGVDSGQAGIYDEDYYKQYHTTDDCDDDWYEDICSLTNSLTTPYGTKDNKCVVSGSGYGDGGYDCYLLKDENNEVVGIQVVFIEDDEEDDAYDEYEEDDYDEYEDDYEEYEELERE